jgi:pimeloyl-ACP methyl ester carboxylesterase
MASTELESRRDEARALGRLAFDELRDAAGGIGAIHRGIADRVFRLVGPPARSVEVTHNRIAGGVYATVGGAFGVAGRATDAALELSGATPETRLSSTPRGAAVIAAITGLIGDKLERDGSPLVAPMGLRVDGEPVTPDRESLAAAFPGASSRLVVFLHGLMESEFAWRLGAGPGGETYGSRLAADIGCTPVYIRYNTGLHVSENGRALADLLEAVVANWPVPASEIALVGHSMGALVARSACHYASGEGTRGGFGASRTLARGRDDRASWPRKVTHIVSLGTPHLGAPLEQAVHYASAALSVLPETQPFGSFLRRRSAGIRDLRQGSLVDEDWQGRHPDALKAAACHEIPLLEGATHCFVAATVTRNPRHPVARLIGDWLVLEASASGHSKARRIPFKAEHGMHVGGAGHLALLNHPVVYERLREWLTTPSPASPRRRLLPRGRG